MIASVLAKLNVDLHTPECATLPLSEMVGDDRRLDAEVYLSDGFMVRSEIRRSGLQVSRLGELANVWQPGRLKSIRVGPEHGIPFVAATQAFDIWPTARKWLAPSKTPRLADHYVASDCILVTRSGTVGNAIMTYAAHAGLAISDDLLRVEVGEPELRSYVYAFLRTRFGRAMMRGSHYGNVIKHLEVAHLEQVPVPMLDRLLSTRRTSKSLACSLVATRRTGWTCHRETSLMRRCRIGLTRRAKKGSRSQPLRSSASGADLKRMPIVRGRGSSLRRMSGTPNP